MVDRETYYEIRAQEIHFARRGTPLPESGCDDRNVRVPDARDTARRIYHKPNQIVAEGKPLFTVKLDPETNESSLEILD